MADNIQEIKRILRDSINEVEQRDSTDCEEFASRLHYAMESAVTVIEELAKKKKLKEIFGEPCENCQIIKELSKDSEILEPEKLAVLFHDTYERLAQGYSYETRQDTKVFNPESANGKLMIATCRAITKAMKGEQ